MDNTITDRQHEFGVKKKNGKRVILQIDFPGKNIRIIERGTEKKCCYFEDCNYLRSLEDLSVTIGIKSKFLIIIADSHKEQFTICCLIRSAMEPQPFPDDPEEVIAMPRIKTTELPIKEGYIEKKGHGTIAFWEKRFLRIKRGHFTYYKPRKELRYALHIINISEGITIERDTISGFSVTMKDRTYSFRMINDPKSQVCPEYQLNSWMLAFEQASRVERGTVLATNPRIRESGGSVSSLCTDRDSQVSMLSDFHAPIDTCSMKSLSFHDEFGIPKSLVALQQPGLSNTLPDFRKSAPVPKRSTITNLQDCHDSSQNSVLTKWSRSSDDALSQIMPHQEVEVRSSAQDSDRRTTMHLSAILPTEPLANLTSTRPHPPSFKKKNTVVQCQLLDDAESKNQTGQPDCQNVVFSDDISNDLIKTMQIADESKHHEIDASGASKPCKQKPKPLPRSKSLKIYR